MHITRTHRLACGMPLLMIENHDVAVATADVWVRTGGADEPPELAGVSHFLEHMLFKGTERYGLGEIERAIELLGGVCNAGTSFDFTHYYVTIPSAATGTAIDMLAEMLRHSSLDEGELARERQVILEEYRRKQDHPVSVLFERVYSEVFESGAYHDPIIGHEQTILAIDRPRMLDYYHKRYSPAGSVLVVTGDIDPAVVIERAEAAFAGFDRPLVSLRPEPHQQTGAQKRIHIDRPTGGEIYATFSFAAPGLSRLDRVLPLDIAQSILGQGRASRLFQSIKEKRGLCSSIGCSYPTHLRGSLMVVVATCLPAQLEPLRAALIEELRAFAAEPPAAPALERARRMIASAHRFSLETTSGAASGVGFYYTLTGGTSFFDNYLERLEAVTAEQVREATAEVLRPQAIESALVEVSIGPNDAVAGKGS